MSDEIMRETEERNEEQEERKDLFPCIPLRGVSIFPNTVVHFDIGREKSIRALEKAMATDKLMFVSTQKEEGVLIPTFEDIYAIGCIVKIKQMLKIQGDAVRVLVEGVCRAEVIERITEESYMSCTVKKIEEHIDMNSLPVEDKAAMRILTESFIEYAALTGQVTDEVVDKAVSSEMPAVVVDKITSELMISCSKKQKVLETLDFSERIRVLTGIIAEENEIAVIEKELSQKVKESIDNNQKEYFLREKMKAIQEELGVNEDAGIEAADWLKALEELHLDEKVEAKIKKEIDKFSKMMPSSAEATVIRNYVETILALPWNESSKVNVNLKKAEKILNEDHYGLDKVKERVLEYLAVIHLSKAIKGPILCLVGPPGVGKTSIAKSIARASGREFVRMSLGGVRDEAEIRGHRRTYIGAIPGRVVSCIKDAGTNNPVFLFDEVDKIGADFKGDPASALLEVLDPEQNNTFTDHFLEIPFDLSKVMFITTANSTDTIPRPLLDRMEIVEVPGYTEEEKVKISQRYLIPKKTKEHGLKKENIKISEKALHDLINYYTRESGVRNLEREIANLCRKVARKIVTNKAKSYTITPGNLEKYLGKKRYHYDIVEGENQVGVTTGLAWTIVGGDTLQIETTAVAGSGKLVLTGQLGDVMQESAKAGISYIRSVADKLNIEEDFYKKYDLHVHIPEGAVPKDGPSAGVTMCTAVISTLTNTPVRRDVAMTGEITLRGKVLPVGGIREKVLAAHRAGIKKVLLPRENERDISEIPNAVRKQLEFVLIDDVSKALEEAMVK
ncbi:endopeptidase La [Emergencia timonensis]|nr:endopeptidase La [Emergencia timonensis]WNX87211.1 endopeptidase La [Emergencia timonensis]